MHRTKTLFIIEPVFLRFLLLSIILLLTTQHSHSQTNEDDAIFSIASFNIHYISLRREVLPWNERRDAVTAAMAELNADIVAFQEMETWAGRGERSENIQLDWISQNAPQYSIASVGDPEIYPSTQPILYKTDKFKLIDQGFFFFSERPDEIYSRPWDQSFSAFASWSQFEDLATNQRFRVVNVHFDHSSKINRHGAAHLVSDRINPWLSEQEPVIVIGDFNALSWFKTIDILLEDDRLELADRAGSTFHFNKGLNLFPAIDHVIYSGFEQLGKTLRLNKKYEGVWPSDHYPIKVDLKFLEAE